MLVARGNRTEDQWKGTDDFVFIISVIYVLGRGISKTITKSKKSKSQIVTKSNNAFDLFFRR